MLQGNTQTMFIVPIPSLFLIGFVIAIALLLIGIGEKKNLERRMQLIRSGLILFGLLIILIPLVWYTTHIGPSGNYLITIEEIIITTFLCSLGGVIIGSGLVWKLYHISTA